MASLSRVASLFRGRVAQARSLSTQTAQPQVSNLWRGAMGLCGVGAVGSAAALAYTEVAMPVYAEEEFSHPPHYGWDHQGYTETFDHASIRRGYEVYKQVCAACHSLDRIAFRNLIGEVYTEPEVKAMAAEYECQDKEPNDKGDMFMRPCKPSDYMPAPYANENASRAANDGAYPPDLSVIVKARHGGEDYVFSLLTGYCDAPAGYDLPEGKNFNPYFVGSAIGMAAPLYDEIIEYEDGTPATTSQLAKDVSVFLAWTAMPEHDERKRMGLKAAFVMSLLMMSALYLKRHTWAPLKSRKVIYNRK